MSKFEYSLVLRLLQNVAYPWCFQACGNLVVHKVICYKDMDAITYACKLWYLQYHVPTHKIFSIQ